MGHKFHELVRAQKIEELERKLREQEELLEASHRACDLAEEDGAEKDRLRVCAEAMASDHLREVARLRAVVRTARSGFLRFADVFMELAETETPAAAGRTDRVAPVPGAVAPARDGPSAVYPMAPGEEASPASGSPGEVQPELVQPCECGSCMECSIRRDRLRGVRPSPAFSVEPSPASGSPGEVDDGKCSLGLDHRPD